MKKDTIIYLILGAIVIIILAVIFLNQDPDTPPIIVSEEIAKCIGEKAIVYSSATCSACKKQAELFGESYKHIPLIDCHTDSQKCAQAQITATPTWIINNQEYIGVQSVEKLQELTEC